MNRLSIESFKRIISWATRNESVRSLLLTGSTSAKLQETDYLPHYQVTVVANDLEFLEGNLWIADIQEFLVCLYDYQAFGDLEIHSRIILFKGGSNIQFLFLLSNHANDLFNSRIIPKPFIQSCKTLLKKDLLTPVGNHPQRRYGVSHMSKQDLIYRATKILN